MNNLAFRDDYGTLVTPNTLTIQRLLPGPIERVWAYLTDSGLRRQWLAAGDMEMKPGSAFEFVWRNDELSDPPGKRPEGFSEEMRMASRIVEVDPPNRLVFTWEGSGDVTFDLQRQGGKVMLTVTHRRLPDRDTLLKVAAGWHMHLDILVARANGMPAAEFWSGWQRLHADYGRRIPA